MATSEKARGFLQNIFATSATAKERLGRVRRTDDGRTFMYCKAGASALAAGKITIAEALNATWVDEAITTGTVQAIGAQTFTLTITTAGAAISENQFQGGYLQINDKTACGTQYLIDSNTAVAASGTSITLTLDEPIRVALDATSEFTLVSSLGWKVTHTATALGRGAGVPPVAVPAGYFFWNQIGGVANVLVAGTIGVGILVCVSGGVAGAIHTLGTLTHSPVGQMIEAGVNTEYQPIRLMLGY